MTLPLSAPMLDLLVLSVIAEEDAYGYQIGRIIKRASATMKDSALYPILKRLQENHFVETYDGAVSGKKQEVLYDHRCRETVSGRIDRGMGALSDGCG